MQLAAMGVRHLQLIDFDRVEATNITTQAYSARDVGMWKVAATARTVREIDMGIKITLVQDRFRPTREFDEAIGVVKPVHAAIDQQRCESRAHQQVDLRHR